MPPTAQSHLLLYTLSILWYNHTVTDLWTLMSPTFGESECSAFQDNFIPSVFLSQRQLVIFSDEYRIWTFRLLTAFIISSRWQEDLCPLVMEVESLHGYLSAAYVSLLCLPSHYSPKTCVQLCHVVQSNGLHALIASLEKKKEKSVIFHWSYQKDFLQLDDFCVPHFAFSFKFQVQMNPK